MKAEYLAVKQSKSGGVTVREARAAVRAVRGDRPAGKFLLVETSRSKALREKYLGQIVHAPSKSGSSTRARADYAQARAHESVQQEEVTRRFSPPPPVRHGAKARVRVPQRAL